MRPPDKILVADDERHIVRLLEVNLVRAGYKVVTAYDAAGAAQVAVREKPDLILLDATMAQVDGREALDLLRADPQTRAIPVVMLTPKGAIPDSLRGRPFVGSALLAKPFNPRDMLVLVRRILGDSRAATPRERPVDFTRSARFPDPGKIMEALYRMLRAFFGRGR